MYADVISNIRCNFNLYLADSTWFISGPQGNVQVIVHTMVGQKLPLAKPQGRKVFLIFAS
jgi:hypothetical protein